MKECKCTLCLLIFVCVCVCVCVFELVFFPYTLSPANDNVVLESVQYRGQHVGVLPSGEIKEPGRTGTGQHGQFRFTLHKKPEVSIETQL